jgi:hypothetical protein
MSGHRSSFPPRHATAQNQRLVTLPQREASNHSHYDQSHLNNDDNYISITSSNGDDDEAPVSTFDHYGHGRGGGGGRSLGLVGRFDPQLSGF